MPVLTSMLQIAEEMSSARGLHFDLTIPAQPQAVLI
jgi:hypothetical protein